MLNNIAEQTAITEKTPSDAILANAILDIIFDKRRLLSSEEITEINETAERQIHFEKIYNFIKDNKQIEMVLPAFPVKSPNRSKTLDYLPDYAEQHAFQQLNLLCQQISDIYPPGATILICSDGRVFSDLLTIPDTHVTEYSEALKAMVNKRHPGLFKFFNLDDVFHAITCFETMREELMVLHGEPLSDLIYRTKNDSHAKAMYLGITRFILEDYSGIEPFKHQSRTSIQKVAKHVAYRIIQRSNAWSRLLKAQFPAAIRLSIHPQFRVSEKIGVYLGNAQNNWVTPWHSVAVLEGNHVFYMKRADIESEPNVLLAYHDGKPSHYIRQPK